MWCLHCFYNILQHSVVGVQVAVNHIFPIFSSTSLHSANAFLQYEGFSLSACSLRSSKRLRSRLQFAYERVTSEWSHVFSTTAEIFCLIVYPNICGMASLYTDEVPQQMRQDAVLENRIAWRFVRWSNSNFADVMLSTACCSRLPAGLLNVDDSLELGLS